MALNDSTFAILANGIFEKLIQKKEMKKTKKIAKFLMDTPYFNNCRPYSIYRIQYYFELKKFIKGQIVCNLGANLDYLYFVKTGEFEVIYIYIYIYIYII